MQNFLYFSLCPLLFVLLLGTTEKSLSLPSLHPPFRFLYALMRCHLSLPFSRLNSPSSLSLFFIVEVLHSIHHPCGPLFEYLQKIHVSLVQGRPELDTVLQAEGKDYFLQFSDETHNAAQDTVHLLCGEGTSLAPVKLGVHQAPRPFSAKLHLHTPIPQFQFLSSSIFQFASASTRTSMQSAASTTARNDGKTQLYISLYFCFWILFF